MAKRIDILTLTAGHSLIIGHKPLKLDNERLAQHLEEIKSDTLNFGLFDSSAPNYTTYYPDLKTEDLNPKDEEFVFPVYRMLSEVVVAKKRNPVDFSKKGGS